MRGWEITERVAVLSDSGTGYTVELNMVSFFGNKPKLDLRKWHEGMPLKGIALTEQEVEALREALQKGA